MRVVKLNAVKARGLGAPRGGRKQRRQRLRQVANMRQLHVRNAFAEALHERFVLAGGQRLLPAGLAEFKQAGAHIRFAGASRSDRASVGIGHLQESLEKF